MLLMLLNFLLLLPVRLNVKICKETKKDGRLTSGEPEGKRRIIDGPDVNDDAVQAKQEKLQQLNLGDVLFPPQVRLNLRSQRREGVVGVHYSVTTGVEKGEEVDGRHAKNVPDVVPAEDRYNGVVVQVQVSDLAVLLPQYKEDGVEEVDKLGQPVQVEGPHLLAGVFSVELVAGFPLGPLEVDQLTAVV